MLDAFVNLRTCNHSSTCLSAPMHVFGRLRPHDSRIGRSLEAVGGTVGAQGPGMVRGQLRARQPEVGRPRYGMKGACKCGDMCRRFGSRARRGGCAPAAGGSPRCYPHWQTTWGNSCAYRGRPAPVAWLLVRLAGRSTKESEQETPVASSAAAPRVLLLAHSHDTALADTPQRALTRKVLNGGQLCLAVAFDRTFYKSVVASVRRTENEGN